MIVVQLALAFLGAVFLVIGFAGVISRRRAGLENTDPKMRSALGLVVGGTALLGIGVVTLLE